MAISPDGIIGNAVEAVTSQLAILNNTAGQYRGELSAALAQIAAVQVKDAAQLKEGDAVITDQRAAGADA